MVNFALNSFLKICLMDTGSRIVEIQRRLAGPGGYDFYRPFQKSVRAFCDADFDAVEQILSAPTKVAEKKYNRAAFEGFKVKFGEPNSCVSFSQPEALKFPEHEMSIFVDPLFFIDKSSGQQIYSLWPTKSPKVTQRYGAVACFIMRQAYVQTRFSNASFFLYDVISEKLYSEKQINSNTELILKADVASISALLKQL